MRFHLVNNMCQSEDRLGKPSTPLLPPPSTSLISHCACKLIMRTHRIRSTTVGYEKLGTKKVHGEFGKCVIIVILSERYGKCVAEHTTFYVQFQMGKRAHSHTHIQTQLQQKRKPYLMWWSKCLSWRFFVTKANSFAAYDQSNTIQFSSTRTDNDEVYS